jgi:chromosome segregation ATPase
VIQELAIKNKSNALKAGLQTLEDGNAQLMDDEEALKVCHVQLAEGRAELETRREELERTEEELSSREVVISDLMKSSGPALKFVFQELNQIKEMISKAQEARSPGLLSALRRLFRALKGIGFNPTHNLPVAPET